MNWLAGKRFDLTLFHFPVWLCWAAAFLMPEAWRQAPVPTWVWVCFVLGVDVGHVWSSIYRTYLDPDARVHHRWLLRLLPIACYLPLLALALHSDQLFWRVLAYVAVFHFIKQQVGIAALYRYRHLQGLPNLEPVWKHRLGQLDKLTVYAGTVCPMVYWHFSPDRQFNWFIPNDFIFLDAIPAYLSGLPGGEGLILLGKAVFFLVWFGLPLLWLVVHLWLSHRQTLTFPLGKFLWVFGTWANWYLGIVHFDSDLVFTITNVVAHGVPYYALIGLYSLRKAEHRGYGRGLPAVPAQTMARIAYAGVFLLPILLLALGEEYLWNFLIYRDFGDFFEALWAYPMEAVAHPGIRAALIALLSMPQVLHYLLDGFIWKFNHRNPDLRNYLFP